MSAGPEEPASTPAHRVFISYRREDSAAYAGRVYDAMVARFGERNVFMDLELAPGVDFVDRITEAVSACQVLIEVIGPTWATVKNQEGEVRIADPEDFVRLELEIALKRPEVTVIPVLVSGARMPDRQDLPPELGAISRRNALELSDRRWRYDVGQLISALEELLAGTTAVHVTPTTADVAAKTEASPKAAPTGPAQIPAGTADLGRAGEWHRGHGRLLAGVAALALVLVGVVLAIGALSGGSGGGGLEFEPFTSAEAFKTVDVPAGWRPSDPSDIDKPTPAPGLKTILTNPDNEGSVEIVREPDDKLPEDRLDDALGERSGESGYSFITKGPQNVDDREAQLFEYEHDEHFGGATVATPATVVTYFFNAGSYGWRTRAAVAQAAGDSAEMAKEIATTMATTLEPP